MDRLGVEENVPIEARLVSKSIENAQKKLKDIILISASGWSNTTM